MQEDVRIQEQGEADKLKFGGQQVNGALRFRGPCMQLFSRPLRLVSGRVAFKKGRCEYDVLKTVNMGVYVG